MHACWWNCFAFSRKEEESVEGAIFGGLRDLCFLLEKVGLYISGGSTFSVGVGVNMGCFESNMALCFALKGDGFDEPGCRGGEGFEVRI